MSDSEFFSKSDFSFSDSFGGIRRVFSSARGHTEVYEARKALKRFALKALKPELREDPFYIGMLRKEFEIGFRLDHPRILHTYSFEEVEGLGPCIVLEWIEGETLASAIEHKGLDEKGWQRVVAEMCDALEYLESRQIVHRDIKPSNLMLTADGHHVKLIDFGFADSPEYAALKVNGGTAGYTSPEQLTEAQIRGTSDLYALGRVIEELPIRRGKKVRNLIRGLTAEQPSERPQSAGEVKAAWGKIGSSGVNVFLLLSAIIAAAVVAFLILIPREPAENGDEAAAPAVGPDVEEVVAEQPSTEAPSVGAAVEPVKDAAKEAPVEMSAINPAPVAEQTTEETGTPAVNPQKRVVHWMVLLTAEQTRGMSRKFRENGDAMWEEHVMEDLGAWVDSQTKNDPALREECHQEIRRVLELVKASSNKN
ncbi:MAG: serine/threonine protein kinase [Muribaculaceae bacterium]|nr:serine/threonine protein kinase [Muribaculaceae bacterium]